MLGHGPPANKLTEKLGQSIACEDLRAAERALNGLQEPELEDLLGLVLLMRDEHDARYERAATKWLGRVLVARPRLGFRFAGNAIRALRDIDGVQPEVGRASLALLLRSVDLPASAAVAEKRR